MAQQEATKFDMSVKRVKYGRHVTVITLDTSDDVKRAILRELKRRLGTGGTVKNGEIILQGNQKGRYHIIESVVVQHLS